MDFPVLWLVLVAMVIVVGSVVTWVRHRRKTERMRSFARSRGWQYTPADRSLVDRWPGSPFGAGSQRRTSHVVSGAHRGASFIAFEYRYTESDGDSATTRRFTVVVLDLPASRSRLKVTRETGTSRFLGRFGFRGLQLESEEFNETFRIDTDDERFAYDVLHPRMMEWLLAGDRAPFRFDGGHLVAWRSVPVEPEEVVSLLEYVCDIRDRVPSFVWNAA